MMRARADKLRRTDNVVARSPLRRDGRQTLRRATGTADCCVRCREVVIVDNTRLKLRRLRFLCDYIVDKTKIIIEQLRYFYGLHETNNHLSRATSIKY